MNFSDCKRLFATLFVITFSFSIPVHSADKKPMQEYYEIKVYHFATSEQETMLDNYLKTAYLPALHKTGIKQVGVFKPLVNDTAADKRIYVFFTASSLEKLVDLPKQLLNDITYTNVAKDYMEAGYDHPPFARFETILLRAFPLAPQMNLPALTGDKKERVYELRSYEGPTEKLYNTKVKMFNEGGEIALFKRLNFNAVFYSEVISGSRMPNLMYMTSFENMTDRDTHWDSFRNDAEWKRLSGLPEYQHTVSKAEIILLHPADYSDF